MIFGIGYWEFALLALALLAAGSVTGVLAGLFGVGGGAVIVPVLYEVFRLLGVPDEVRMPLCVGTSLAIIVPTSWKSFQGHKARGAVDMDVLRTWAVPIVAGVLVGAVIARFAPPALFKLVFIFVAGTNALKLLLGRDDWRIADKLPDGPLMRAYGGLIGLLSSLMGIGGGAISNMLFGFHNWPIHRSVATSAGIGVLISIPGALGYIGAGPGKAGLPPLSLGFVSLLGFALFVPTTVLTTKFGVALAHAWPKRKLEVAFGLFQLAMCLRFIATLF